MPPKIANRATIQFMSTTSEADFSKQIMKVIQQRFVKAAHDGRKVIQDRIGNGLATGQDGFVGILETPIGFWITSPEGLGELGFPSLLPIDDLMNGIKASTEVRASQTLGFELHLNLFNLVVVGNFTPHPASKNTPSLRIKSWFVDWFINKQGVHDAGFVNIKKLENPKTLPRSYSAAGDQAGFMLKFPHLGSTGSWNVPRGLDIKALNKWLNQNKRAIVKILVEEVKKRL